MVERAGVKVATFGGPRNGGRMEFKGMAGNQVLDWAALDTEIKSARVKDVRRTKMLVSVGWVLTRG